ncbi:MAG: hypothetical protein OEW87_09490 [Flavobacteriaceae bacterium]|nr:hypothetical protein [Flavobacteriaceae bacterium]
MKPLFDIKEVNINCKCNQESTIDVEFIVHCGGPARICFDIPAAIPVFFKSTGSNSICHTIPNPKVEEKQKISIPLIFETSKEDYYTYILTGSLTDFDGNTRSDYIGINLNCS